MTNPAYSMHPLKSAAIKIGRANEHLARLENEVASIFETHKNNLVRHIDENTGRYVFRVYTGGENAGVSATLGDAVHNLRGALDSIAYGFKASEHTMFPIHLRDTAGFRSRLASIFPLGDHETVERFQPYKAGDAAEQHPLWAVHRLDIVDKHRALVPIVNTIIIAGVNPRTSETFDYERYYELWTEPDPNLKPEFSIRIPLSAEVPGTLVPIGIVSEAYRLIRFEVLPDFAGFFPERVNLIA